jgi:hypothetical protein
MPSTAAAHMPSATTAAAPHLDQRTDFLELVLKSRAAHARECGRRR